MNLRFFSDKCPGFKLVLMTQNTTMNWILLSGEPPIGSDSTCKCNITFDANSRKANLVQLRAVRIQRLQNPVGHLLHQLQNSHLLIIHNVIAHRVRQYWWWGPPLDYCWLCWWVLSLGGYALASSWGGDTDNTTSTTGQSTVSSRFSDSDNT